MRGLEIYCYYIVFGPTVGEGGSYFSSSSSFMSLKNEMFYERLYSGAFVRAIFVSSLLLPYLIQLSTK